MAHALGRAGAEELITPREIIRDYLTLLNVLRDNPGATLDSLLSGLTFSPSIDSDDGDDDGAAAPSPTAPTNPADSIPLPKKIGLFDIDI